MGAHQIQVLDDGVDVLVPASTAVNDHPRPVLECRREPLKVGNGMAGLKGRDDALQLAEALESIKGFLWECHRKELLI